MTPVPGTCAQCRASFDTKTVGTWLRVEGWAIVRSTGGYNVRDQEPTGKVLCPRCGRERELGIMPGQESLL